MFTAELAMINFNLKSLEWASKTINSFKFETDYLNQWSKKYWDAVEEQKKMKNSERILVSPVKYALKVHKQNGSVQCSVISIIITSSSSNSSSSSDTKSNTLHKLGWQKLRLWGANVPWEKIFCFLLLSSSAINFNAQTMTDSYTCLSCKVFWLVLLQLGNK